MTQLYQQLADLLKDNKNFFIKISDIDFTKPIDFKLQIFSKSTELNIQVKDIETLHLLKTAFQDINLVCWDIKNLYSLVLKKTNVDFEFGKILDLMVIESFLGIYEKPPNTFLEAMIRMKEAVADPSWKNLYYKIYLPLITKVIPNMETAGIIDCKNNKILYSHYVLGGKNGRLSCQIVNNNYFNPHSLTQERKSELRAKKDLVYLIFDFATMEVCVLGWLSKDERLNELIQEGDFYKGLYKLLTNKECDTEEKRSFCKKLFLPLIYGQSPKTLVEDPETSLKINSRLRQLFPGTFAWVENYPAPYLDYFGRKRTFEEEYKYRNFIIQSPAAVICLEKLIKLHEVAKVAMNVHDGYVIEVEDKQVETVKLKCLKVLEGESELCPGLRLKVDFKISKYLS